MEFFRDTLPNGLTLIGEQRESAVSVGVAFFVKTGARDEVPEVSGVSHFLEHMVFKGTQRRSALDITYQLAALGAQTNAYTTEENTVYYVSVLPEYFEAAFEILADMMRPALDADEFATEKKVILEEIALYRDRPAHVLYEAALKSYFGRHRAGNPVLGTEESLTALTVEQMQSYFAGRYSPTNMVLTVTGKFDWDHVRRLAHRFCADWKAHTVENGREPYMPAESHIDLRREHLQCAHICLIADGPAADDEERYAVQILSCILGDAVGSRTYWDLVDRGLADSASIDSDEMDRTGIVMAYASCLPEHVATVSEAIERIMRTPADFSDDQLVRAVTKLRTRLVLQGESSMRRLMAVGLDWIYRNDYLSLEEELARLKAVTRNSIEHALGRFTFTPMTKALLLPA